MILLIVESSHILYFGFFFNFAPRSHSEFFFLEEARMSDVLIDSRQISDILEVLKYHVFINKITP